MADVGEHAALLELEAAAHRDVQQLAATPLADKARSQQLSAGIQDKLARIRAITRDLELEVEELDGDEERAALAAQLAGHKREYAGLQAALKDAALAQRAAALRSAQEERKELLASGEAGLRQRRAQLEGDAVAAAEDVTGGLRRTRQVLAEELEHTSATLAAMEASHMALGRTRDEYHGQHRKLKKSKGLLGTLNWQNKAETYMLWMGLALFLAVCAFIFQKRAGHFIPEPLKPSNLLAGLRGPPRVGKPLSAPPSGRLRAESAPHAVRPPASPSPREQQQWQEGDAEAVAAVGRGRAPPPDALRRTPLLPPEDAPADGREGKEAQPAAQPYGGFTDRDEALEEVQPVYQPAVPDATAAQHKQEAQPEAQAQAAAVEEHPPAEWPSGAPEPQQGEQEQEQPPPEQQAPPLEQQQARPAEQRHAQQQGDAPLEQQPAADEQPAAAEEPSVDDLTLPAVDAVQAASMAADLAAGQVAAAVQAEQAGQQGGSAGEAADPVQEAGHPTEEGEPSDAAQQEGGVQGAANEQPQEQPAAERQAEPEQQPQAAAGATEAAEAQPGELEEHASAEWPSGAPEPKDEL